MKNLYIFPLLFFVMWVGISLLLSYISGWRELAQYYRYQNEIIPKKKNCQSAGIRGVNYRGCLTIGGNEQGLYISIIFLFAVGCPSLFIPWKDIKIVKKKYLGLFPALELSISRTPSIKVRLFQSIEGFLQEICGNFLIIEEAPSKKLGEIDWPLLISNIKDFIPRGLIMWSFALFMVTVAFLIIGEFYLDIGGQHKLITPQNNPTIFWRTEAGNLFIAILLSLCAYILYRIRRK